MIFHRFQVHGDNAHEQFHRVARIAHRFEGQVVGKFLTLLDVLPRNGAIAPLSLNFFAESLPEFQYWTFKNPQQNRIVSMIIFNIDRSVCFL
ncbi:hypothetical protein C8R34_11266 [Nitrosomonas sp. Nm84]|nr:hypothetical protein C8R34_11266 [Nitrosomonas sp. Nm84]